MAATTGTAILNSAMDHSFLRRWLTGFWLILAVVAALIWIMRLAAVLDPDQGPYYVTTGSEDISVFNFSRMRYGDPVYVDCFEYPYRASLFNWCFYWLYGLVVAVVNPSELMLPLVLRLVTLAWALAGCVALVRFLRQPEPGADATLPIWTTVSLSLVTWFGLMMGWWTLTARADVPAVVCEFLGLVLVARGAGRLSLPRALAAGALFFLAWSFKQSAVFIFAGTMLALLLRREWSNVVRVAGVFVVLVAVVLLCAPRAYFINLFEAPALAPLVAEQLGEVLYWSVLSWLPLPFLGIAAFLLCLNGAERLALLKSRPGFLLAVVIVVTLTVNILATRRRGSSGNYLFESWVVGMALTGLIQEHAVRTEKTFAANAGRLLFFGFSALLSAFALLCLVPLFTPLHKPDTQPVDLMVYLPHQPYSERLLNDVRTSPRPILSDDPGLVRVALGAESGDIPVVDYTIFWDARAAGKLSRPDVIDRIAKHEYAHVWVLRSNFPDALSWETEARKAGYVEVKVEGDFRQYRRP